MRPIDAVLPHQSGTSSGSSGDSAFNAAVGRQPPPPQCGPVQSGGRLPGFSLPVCLPPVPIKVVATDQPRPPLLPLPAETNLFRRPANPAAEAIRTDVFERGMSFDEAARKRGMDQYQGVSALNDAAGVTANTVQSSSGTQITISDARSGKTVTITDDHEKATRSVSVEREDANRDTHWVDGNGAIVRTTHDAKTGIRTTRIEDPKAHTVIETTVPEGGPAREITTDAHGKKTVKTIGDDYTTTTAPGGKVTVTDHKTGTSTALERMTLPEALKRDKKLARQIEAATKDCASLGRQLKAAGLSPEKLDKPDEPPDPSRFTLGQATAYERYVAAQAKLLKLKLARGVLGAQYGVSVTRPGTEARGVAVNNLLDAAHLQNRMGANADASLKLARAAIPLIQSRGEASRVSGQALDAFRRAPGHENYFRPGGWRVEGGTTAGNSIGHGGDTGKLLKQEIVYKDGHLYLKNTYQNKVFGLHNESNVDETPLTVKVSDPGLRTAAERQADVRWQAARDRHTKALSAYKAAEGELARTTGVDANALIVERKNIYDNAVKKHGLPAAKKPSDSASKGEEPVRIQVDGETRWAHPEVAKAYLGLRSAQAEAARLEAEARATDQARAWLDLKPANPKTPAGIESPEDDKALWKRHAGHLLQLDQHVNSAQGRYAALQGDGIQTQIGIKQAQIAAWRRTHPQLASRLDALQKRSTEQSCFGPGMSTRPATDDTAKQIDAILDSPEARPLTEAQEQIKVLQTDLSKVSKLQRELDLERQWISNVQRMPADERGDQRKRGDLRVQFVRQHAQDYSEPAQALQRELGGPIIGRDRELVRSMVQKMSGNMRQAGIEIDVGYVVNQILRSSQINGDNPAQAGDLTIKLIAMQYQEGEASMRTGVFEVTNQQGRSFLVDLKGQIWSGRDEFLNNNALYSDKGILLMPKNFDMAGGTGGTIQYEARTARNLSTVEAYVDPIIAVATAGATLFSWVPGVGLAALAGGTYLGLKSGYNQYQHLQHGGSWSDDESAANALDVVATATPLVGSGFRTAALASRSVSLRGAVAFSTGAASRHANYFARAEYLSRASLLHRQGFGSMRAARALDGIGLAAGLPSLAMSAPNLAQLDEMSGYERLQTLMSFGTGVFGTGMGAAGLHRTRAGRNETIRVEDAPPLAPTDANQRSRRWSVLGRSRGAVPGDADQNGTSGDQGTPLALTLGQRKVRGNEAPPPNSEGGNSPAATFNDGKARPIIHSALAEYLAGVREPQRLTAGEIESNRAEALTILKRLTRGLTRLNGIESLRLEDLADQFARVPLGMRLLRISDANKVLIIDGATNPLQVYPREHQNNNIESDSHLNLVTLQSDEAHRSGPENYVAELTVDLAHELYHLAVERPVSPDDAPAGLQGFEAFKAAYTNVSAHEEGAAGLIEFAMADALAINDGRVPPSLYLDSGRSTERDTYHQFLGGDLDWHQAAHRVGAALVTNAKLPYANYFDGKAAAIWRDDPNTRRAFEATQFDDGDVPPSRGPLGGGRKERWEGPAGADEVRETDLAEQVSDPDESTPRSRNLVRAFDSLPGYGGWPPNDRDEVGPVIVRGADIPDGISPHEFLLQSSLHRIWVRRSQSIVLDLPQPTSSNYAFAQTVADISGTHILVSKIDDPNGWEVFSPRPPVQRQVQTVELGEDGTLHLVADGNRSRIRPEDHLGHLMGFGDHSTAFEIGDKVALVGHHSDSPDDLAALIDSRDRLEGLGIPHLAKVYGSTTVYGRQAVLMDRYYVNSRDAVSYLSRYPVHDVSLLNQRSVESLEGIRSFLINNRLDISDLQFLIGSDGTFHLADYGQILTGGRPSDDTIETIDTWIARAEGRGPADEAFPSDDGGPRLPPVRARDEGDPEGGRHDGGPRSLSSGALVDGDPLLYRRGELSRLKAIVSSRLPSPEIWGASAKEPSQLIKPPFDITAAIEAANATKRLTDEEMAAIREDDVPELLLERFSADELRAFTGEQVGRVTDEQKAKLSADQLAALDSPRLTGFRRGMRSFGTEARQYWWSYLGFGGSALGVYLASRYLGIDPMHGGFQLANASAYGLRGLGFIVHSFLPDRWVEPHTRTSRLLNGLYFATSVPNVVSSVMNAHGQPLVYAPYAVGIVPFSAAGLHNAVTGKQPPAPFGYHLGYAGYTVGSAFYAHPAFHTADYMPGWVEPTSAGLFLGGSIELWAGQLLKNRRANRAEPMPGSQRGKLGTAVDEFLLDRRGKFNKRLLFWADRAGLGLGYGGGLVLFSWMGVAQFFEEKEKAGQVSKATKESSDVILPPDIPLERLPEKPQPMERPRIVTVERWRPDDSRGDNSALWNIADDNLPMLLTPQQRDRIERDGLSLEEDRSTLVAKLGLPRLIDLNPQYPLARNPDLIRPGWRLNVE